MRGAAALRARCGREALSVWVSRGVHACSDPITLTLTLTLDADAPRYLPLRGRDFLAA